MKTLSAVELVDFKKLLEVSKELTKPTTKNPLKYSRIKYTGKDEPDLWLYDVFVHHKHHKLVEYHFFQFLKNVQRDIELLETNLEVKE